MLISALGSVSSRASPSGTEDVSDPAETQDQEAYPDIAESQGMSAPGISESQMEELNERFKEEYQKNPPPGMSGDTSETPSAFEIISDPDMDITYDEAGSRYSYSAAGKVSWYISVPVGATSSGPVRLELGDGTIIITCKKDGEDAAKPDFLYFKDPGVYTLELLGGGQELNKTTDSYSGRTDFKTGNFKTSISFTVKDTSHAVNDLDTVKSPDGFFIKKASLDGQTISSDQDQLTVVQDGTYDIQYALLRNPEVMYELHFTSDKTAPELTFSRDISKKSVRAPVVFTKQDPDSTVSVFLDGMATGNSNQITDGGRYTVSVKDAAGNSNSYTFYVKYSMPYRYLLIGAAGLLIIGGLYFLLYRDQWERIL